MKMFELDWKQKNGGNELCRLVRQRNRAGKNVQHVRVMKDENGNAMVSSEAVLRDGKSTLRN